MEIVRIISVILLKMTNSQSVILYTLSGKFCIFIFKFNIKSYLSNQYIIF